MATQVIPTAPQATVRGPGLLRDRGRVVLGGNELIVKGALEAGVSLITGYPGSPVAEVFLICEEHADALRELGVEAVLANNEAQSAGMLNGARQVPGARSMTVFKSVGAYVALDGLAIANSAEAAEGAAAVVVVGDDTMNSSTQVGADSRITMSAGRIPVLEPATSQEVKDLIRLAFALSAESGLIVAVMVTTTQADGTAVVEVAPNRSPQVGPLNRVELDTRVTRPGKTVSLPPYTSALEDDVLHRRFPALHAAAAAHGLSRVEHPRPGAPIGLITAGAAYPMLLHALHETRHRRRPADPADRTDVATRSRPRARVRRHRGRDRRVRGACPAPRSPGADRAGGAPPVGVGQTAARRRGGTAGRRGDRTRVSGGGDRTAGTSPPRGVLRCGARTGDRGAPGRCPACGRPAHADLLRRMSAPRHEQPDETDESELRKRLRDPVYMRQVHDREPVDVIAHGGIGCYSMNYLPPFNEMDNLSAMGLGGATGAGAAPLVTNKHYTLVGDGTFFHGEMSTLANAIKQNQDILYIILDNKNTAMTGHQGTPGSATDLMGRPQHPLEIEAIVHAV